MIEDVKRGAYKFIFALVTFNILIWLAVFLYGMFYYLYIPAVAHFRTVYFQFDTVCPEGVCGLPSANITLVKRGQDQLLSRGQPYIVVLDLEMPESITNQNLGMFMVKLDMIARNGDVTKTSLRSGVLHFKSGLHQTLRTLLFAPFLLSGTTEEKQLVSVLLFEHYEEDPMKPAHSSHLEIQSHSIEIYSATLRIHAEFTGLRYFMYYWPLLSALLGIGTNFFFLSMISLFSWFRFLLSKGDETFMTLDVSDSATLLETRRTQALERLKKERRATGSLGFDIEKELYTGEAGVKNESVEDVGNHHIITKTDSECENQPEINTKADITSEARRRRP